MTQFDSSIQSPNDFGAYLRTARKARRLTQAQAAGLAGVGVRLWNEAENGKRAQVGLDTALKMLRAVGVELRVAMQFATVVSSASSPLGPKGSQ